MHSSTGTATVHNTSSVASTPPGEGSTTPIQESATIQIGGTNVPVASIRSFLEEHPEALQACRSSVIMHQASSKVKTFIDAEARVVGYSADFALEGAMGALECEMPFTGVRFKIGSGFALAQRTLMSDAKATWPLGTVVTYKYQGLTAANGLPRFATYLRICSDQTWGEIVKDAQADVESEKAEAGGKLVKAPSLMEATAPIEGKQGQKRVAEEEEEEEEVEEPHTKKKARKGGSEMTPEEKQAMREACAAAAEARMQNSNSRGLQDPGAKDRLQRKADARANMEGGGRDMGLLTAAVLASGWSN